MAIVGGASLATVAAMALFTTRATCATNLDRSDWMSVVRRQVLPITDLRTAGDIAPPQPGAARRVEHPRTDVIVRPGEQVPAPIKPSK